MRLPFWFWPVLISLSLLGGCHDQVDDRAGRQHAQPSPGSAPAIPGAAPSPMANIVPELDPETARQANAALAFSIDPIEPAPPIVDSGLKAGAMDSALKCLTQAVYYEAGAEPLKGRRAVAQVVLNRVRHPSFPNTVCGVVYQGAERRTGCQFTFTCDGSLARVPSPRPWHEAEQVARQALAGAVEPSVGLATNYHTDWVYPYWAPSLRKISQVGAHIFYTWQGAWGHRRAFTQAPVWIDTPVPVPTANVEEAIALPSASPLAPPPPRLAADKAAGTVADGPRLDDSPLGKPIADERKGTLVVDGR